MSEQISTIDDAPEVATKVTKPRAKSDAVGQVNTRRTITIHASGDEEGQNAVPVGVNGVVYQIPRGVPCEVPDEVIAVLENAKTSVYKVVNGESVEHQIPRFAYTLS